MQYSEPADRVGGQQARGHVVHTGHAHAGSRPRHAGVAGVADIARPEPAEPAAQKRGREPGGQVGCERRLPVQSRVASGIDDLHDDIGADVDVMGAALGGGHGAWITAQGRRRDLASGMVVLVVLVVLPRAGHSQSRAGAADVLARCIRISIREPTRQRYARHVVDG